MTNIEAKKVVGIAYASFIILAIFISTLMYVNPFDHSDKTSILIATIAIMTVVGTNILNLLKKVAKVRPAINTLGVSVVSGLRKISQRN